MSQFSIMYSSRKSNQYKNLIETKAYKSINVMNCPRFFHSVYFYYKVNDLVSHFPACPLNI